MLDLDAFAAAIRTQESGGNYEAVNEDSGARGAYQILPSNWPGWCVAAGYPANSPWTPAIQDAVATHQMRHRYLDFGNWLDVAAWWYSGSPLRPETADRPQGGYPTIREYAESIVRRMNVADFHWTDYPVPVPPGTITGGFRAIYTDSNGQRYEHAGLDIAAVEGTEIRWHSAAPGTVEWHRPGDGWGDGSFGVAAVCNVVDTPYWAVFAHMTPASWEAGTKPLRNGALLGWVGSTGLSSGPHVHIGLSREAAPNFAPMRRMEGGINRIGNPDLLDPEPFFRIGQPSSSGDLLTDLVRAVFGGEARMRELLAGGHIPLEARVAGREADHEKDLIALAKIAPLTDDVRNLRTIVDGHLANHPSTPPKGTIQIKGGVLDIG